MALDDLWILDDAGLSVPDAASLYDQQKKALQEPTALGTGYLFHPDDPIVQFLEIVTEQLASVYQLAALVHLWRDPDQAQGAALREVGSIVGATIRSRTRSAIEGRIVGTAGTLVPAGKLLKYLANGTIWQTSEAVTIDVFGSVETAVESVDFGPIEADIAGVEGWKALDVVTGWDGFASTSQVQLGALSPDDLEVRNAIRIAATGGGGQATYNSDVQNIGEVDGVIYVALYVNRTGVYDPVQDLDEHSALFVIDGGRKQALFDAIGDTGSTALNCETTGLVQGTTTRSNGQVLKVSYSRVERVYVQLKITIVGGNPQVPLPPVEASQAIASEAAMARNAEQDVGQKFVPVQYAGAVLDAFSKNSITAITVEARLSSLDPWLTTPISMGLVQRAVLRPLPTAAEMIGWAEDPINVQAGAQMDIAVDGGAPQNIIFPNALTSVADVAEEINTQTAGLIAGDSGGRLVIRSLTEGLASTLIIDPADDALMTALGLVEGVLYSGSGGDVEVLVIP